MSEEEEIIRDFVQEAKEHLEGIEEDLLAIEAQGASIDKELVNKVFRAVHSIKGASGFLELKNVEALSHALESVLNKVRKQELIPTEKVVGPLLKGVDVLSRLLQDVHASNQEDIREILEVVEAAESQESPSSSTSVEEVSEETQPASSSHEDEGSLRVSLKTLNSLMTLAGELVLTRNQLLDSFKSQDMNKIRMASQRVDVITSDLQMTIMSTRMQPLGRVFSRFNRVVRDLAKMLDKNVRLVVEGKDVELDKSIIECIGDPLTHLIRNAIDHGIEAPDERRQKGKDSTGTIHLRAFHRAGHVIVEVSDDGKGIDPSKIREKAIRENLMERSVIDRTSDEEIIKLIFHPGFSLAQKVTAISGRGVGMDVVYSNFAQLGGVVDIESTVGKGCLVRIRLPLTLAIIPSLIVRVGQDRFALPQANLVELVSLVPSEQEERVQFVAGSPFLRLRDGILPLVDLRKNLPMEDSEETKPGNIAVVAADNMHYGIMVDDFLDCEEIVVKPLGHHLHSCTSYCGATIRGDGRVTLILDVVGLSQTIDDTANDLTIQLGLPEGGGSQEEPLSLLIVKSGGREHLALPLGLISRIERVERSQIEQWAGRLTLRYHNRSLPLMTFDTLCENPVLESSDLYVFVFNCNGCELGVLASHLLDVTETQVEVDSHSFTQSGIIGSMVIQGNTTLLIDLYELVKRQMPHLACAIKTEDQEGSPFNVLLVDDSQFYRQEMSKILRETGCTVETAEDGEDALNKLKSSTNPVDLVLTDIEMPNLDGLGLIKKIRESQTHHQLPVVAVTSLAGGGYEKEVINLGANKYLLKLAKDELFQVISQFRKNKSLSARSRP